MCQWARKRSPHGWLVPFGCHKTLGNGKRERGKNNTNSPPLLLSPFLFKHLANALYTTKKEENERKEREILRPPSSSSQFYPNRNIFSTFAALQKIYIKLCCCSLCHFPPISLLVRPPPVRGKASRQVMHASDRSSERQTDRPTDLVSGLRRSIARKLTLPSSRNFIFFSLFITIWEILLVNAVYGSSSFYAH